MTLLGMPFEQAAVSYGWGNLYDFANNLPQESATYRRRHPEESECISATGQFELAASTFDAVMMFAHLFATRYGYKGKSPKLYPRPWASKGQKLGSDPIPISEFEKWYYGGE